MIKSLLFGLILVFAGCVEETSRPTVLVDGGVDATMEAGGEAGADATPLDAVDTSAVDAQEAPGDAQDAPVVVDGEVLSGDATDTNEGT